MAIINHFYVIGHKSCQIREITQNNGHYAVQGHLRYQSKAHMRLPISD